MTSKCAKDETGSSEVGEGIGEDATMFHWEADAHWLTPTTAIYIYIYIRDYRADNWAIMLLCSIGKPTHTDWLLRPQFIYIYIYVTTVLITGQYYNNRPSNPISFMTTVGSTSGRLHCERLCSFSLYTFIVVGRPCSFRSWACATQPGLFPLPPRCLVLPAQIKI